MVWYVVGLVRPAKTAPKERKRCVPHSRGTASDILEEGGDDVKSAWPLWAGPHTCYNGNYNGKQGCKAERIRKDCLSSDCSLQLGNMKLESLVIAGQQHRGECVPEPCTHRPSSHEREERPKSSLPVPKAKLLIGTKS